jgi:hypothetical protein
MKKTHSCHFAICDYLQCWNRSTVPTSNVRATKPSRRICETYTQSTSNLGAAS